MTSTEMLLKNILDRLQILDTRIEDIACKQSAIATVVDGLQKRVVEARKWWQDINIRYLLAIAGVLLMIGRYSSEPNACVTPKATADCTYVKPAQRIKLDSILLHKALNFEKP
jgi:gamma-glutamyl phosphate reductase